MRRVLGVLVLLAQLQGCCTWFHRCVPPCLWTAPAGAVAPHLVHAADRPILPHQRRAHLAADEHDGPLRTSSGVGAGGVSDNAHAPDGNGAAAPLPLLSPAPASCSLLPDADLRCMQVGEDTTALNAEWQAGIAGGPGGILNVSEGASQDARRAIVLCEPRDSADCRLQAKGGRFAFVIKRLDPTLVHTTLTFSKTYDQPGVFHAYFEGCCRSWGLYNNAGLAFHLRSSVVVPQSFGDVATSSIAPRLALPAVLPLVRGRHYKIEAIADPKISEVAYVLGGALEMGFGMDSRLGFGMDSHPWGVAAPGPYLVPEGVTVSPQGMLSLATGDSPGCGEGCLLQVSLVAYEGNASTAVDFLVEVLPREGPRSVEAGLLATPHSSTASPAIIWANSSDFMPPENTTFRVSECLDLADVQDFKCDRGYEANTCTDDASFDGGQGGCSLYAAGMALEGFCILDGACNACGCACAQECGQSTSYVGICPSRDYAFTPPYNSPLYLSCFAADDCTGGQHRVFCSEVTKHGHSTDFLRIVFRPAPGSSIRFIRQVNEFPAGIQILDASCGQLIANGTCQGTRMWAGGDEYNSFVDVRWKPTAAQTGLWGLCFVAEDSDGLQSQPACLYIRVLHGNGLIADSLGYSVDQPPSLYSFTYSAPTVNQSSAFSAIVGGRSAGDPGLIMQMVLYRQPAHVIAGEAFTVQPQIAFLDNAGNLLTGLSLSNPTVEVVMSPESRRPEEDIIGDLKANINNGIATFTNLALGREGVGYMLRFTAMPHSTKFQIDTPRFSVLPGALKLKIGVQPAVSTAGEPINGPPKLWLMDFDDNYAALSTKRVSATVLTVSTTEPGRNATLRGQTAVNAIQGAARFDHALISVAGTFQLSFSMGSWTVLSQSFTVKAGKAALFYVDQQPCANPCLDPSNMHQVAGDFFRTFISIKDSYYNPLFFEDDVHYPNATVSLERFPRDFRPGAAILGGNLSVTASALPGKRLGYQFLDLTISEQGMYSIVFKVPFQHINPALSNTSLVFDVTLPVAKLQVTQDPLTSVAGAFAKGPPTVALLDDYEFRTASQRVSRSYLNSTDAVYQCAAACLNSTECFDNSVSYNDTCQAEAAIVAGDITTPVEGLATFDNLIVQRAGVNYRLNIYSSTKIMIVTPFFTVKHNKPARIVVARLPMRAQISEPFGVQPLVALVDEFGNVCIDESTAFVHAELNESVSDGQPMQGHFFLAGIPIMRLRKGIADYHNLAVDYYYRHTGLVSNVTQHRLRFLCNAGSDFLAETNDFEVQAGVTALSIASEPATSIAGQVLQGTPEVTLESRDGKSPSNRSVSVRIVADDCPQRYPEPAPVVPRVVQAEVRGGIPLISSQEFVVTDFRVVGFGENTSRAWVKLIDAAFDCGSNSSAGDLTAAQAVLCSLESCVSEADTAALYLAFTITTAPATGRARVCASAEGADFAVVSVALQQLGTWKLWTTLPIVPYVAPVRIAMNRDKPIDDVTLWWAGRDFDECQAFRTASSDARIAFVLSRDVAWNKTRAYSCPRHPGTGQVYRWASSQEVLALDTIFTQNGNSSAVYSAAACGSPRETGSDDRNPDSLSKQAFIFSDISKVGVYAKADSRENQPLVSGIPSGADVAGLVCVSDEVFLQCTNKCHYGECPVADAQAGEVDESQGLIVKWMQHKQSFLRGQSSTSVVSPEITSYLRGDITGNTIAMAANITVHFSLMREPASWVVVVPNESPQPDFVKWQAGARLHLNKWSAGARYIFGGKGAGWNYSRHEAIHLYTHPSVQSYAWDSFVGLDIVCGDKFAEWPLNTTVDLVFTLHSSVPIYDGIKVVVTLRKAPETPEKAADRMGRAVIFSLPPTPTPPPPPPVVQPTPVPGPTLDFCIRAGAHWRIGGDPPRTEMCSQAAGKYNCGIIWCGKRVRHIDTGGYHSCAIDQDHRLLCWGRNNTGQAGPPWHVRNAQVRSVDAGTYHTCALLVDDSVSCWGDGLRGQTTVPATVNAWKAVSCGTAHSCGIASNGRGHCWGDDTYGQSTVPTEASDLQSISAGFFHTCAVAKEGAGYCWGSKGLDEYDFGQADVPSYGPWKHISAGNLHTCGVLRNGTALCWGLADSGRTQVPSLAAGVQWEQVSAGLLHTCGVTSDSQMHCWGSQALNRLVVRPAAAGPWALGSVGYEHSCGLLKSGRIACWGSVSYGQLAVSAAQFVSFDPPCGAAPSNLSGHHACNANAGSITSFVDVSMSVTTTQAAIYYTTASNTPEAVVDSETQYVQSFRLDVSATVTAQARSLDPEIADGDGSSYNFVVQTGAPTLSVAPPDSLFEAAVYYTQLRVLLVGDASMNPYKNTSILYSTDGTDPLTNSSSVSEYHAGVVLGNTTANSSGHTLLRWAAIRAGALDSDVKRMLFTTQVADVHITPRMWKHVVDARGIQVQLVTSTPDTQIYYTVCPPSRPCASAAVDPTQENSSLYAGNFTVNETGTIVRARAYKQNLASSAVSEMKYTLQMDQPVLSPPPNGTMGFLAPLVLKMSCGVGGYATYSLDGSAPSLRFDSPLSLRNFTLAHVRAVCIPVLAGSMVTSTETTGLYNITLLEIIESSVSESSSIAKADNRLTVSVKTTAAIVQGTIITISGLTGSSTQDRANMPLSHGGLHATWTQASGTLVITVAAPPTSAEPVFAVTDSHRCAEDLPLTTLDLASCDPTSTCAAQLSSELFDLVHGGWVQDFYVDGEHVMSIAYDFFERCTLRDRLTGSSDVGIADCSHVTWRVSYNGTSTEINGVFVFSQHVGASSKFASLDDGAWGVASGVPITSDGPRPLNFWGQGVFDSADAQPGQCDALYTGDATPPIQSDSLRSVLKMTEVDSTLVFSFELKNPPGSQSPASPQIVVRGTYCDALGCSIQHLGPKPMSGAVLGANLSFGLVAYNVHQVRPLETAASVISVALKTNLKISSEICGDGPCSIHISDLPESEQGASVQMGVTSVPETKAFVFECVGYRSCQTTLDNYLPAYATFVSADLEVFIACSDFNAKDEIVRYVRVDGANVEPIASGPWDGCEASCEKSEKVLGGYDITNFAAGAIPVDLAVSQQVDSYSCSQTSTSFVRAQFVVHVKFYYTGSYAAGVISYLLTPANVDPGCVDGASSADGPQGASEVWRDSFGYGCRDYAAFEWCDAAGACGGVLGNGQPWTCLDYAVNDTSAATACCACGGGQRWWTRVSFTLIAMSSAGARAPRVALVRADGGVLLNSTLQGQLVGTPDSPLDFSAVRSLLPLSSGHGVSGVRRRLLEAVSSHESKSETKTTKPSACRVEASIDLGWARADGELYTCHQTCVSMFEHHISQAVAETVVTTTDHVHVTFAMHTGCDASCLSNCTRDCVATSDSGSDYLLCLQQCSPANSGGRAEINVTAESEEECVSMANNLRPALLARALASMRFNVSADFAPGGAPAAYSASGSKLSVMTVIDAGYDYIGNWYEANFAGFRNLTRVPYARQWETDRILTGDHLNLAVSGVARMPGVIADTSCSGYRLRFFTVISDRILSVTSNAFAVRASTAEKLYISPVPSMLAHNSRWPCWRAAACPPTIVVAGMYFSVTATVVDAYNNTCMGESGAIRVARSGSLPHNLDGADAVAAMVACRDDDEDTVGFLSQECFKIAPGVEECSNVPQEDVPAACKQALAARALNASVYGDSRVMLQNGTRVLHLRIQVASQGMQLTFHYVPQNLIAHSGYFAVHSAPLTTMHLEASVLDTVLIAGEAMAPGPRLTLRDGYGNAVMEFLAVTADLLNAPGHLLGNTTETASDGAVDFDLLYIEKAGSNYSLVFSCEGVVTVSRVFEVVHARAGASLAGFSLAVDRAPANAVAGETFTVQPRVRLLDAFGNTALQSAATVAVSAHGLAGTATAQLVQGVASFNDLSIATPGAALLTFQVGTGVVHVNASIEVDPPLRKLRLLHQPQSTMVGTCARPYPLLELLSEDSRPVAHSRKEVTVDIAVNVFRMTSYDLKCESGGCFASTSFRYFLPEHGKLVKAFLDVDVAKTDFDEEAEYVEYILINGVRWAGDAASPGGKCNPNAADLCHLYHKCISRLDVSDLARDNYLTVTAKISSAVNDFCVPRLKTRVQLYGNYRPLLPETATMDQGGEYKTLGGLSTLTANGRSLAFRDLFFPVPGYGYQLRFSTDAGLATNVSTESEPFDVYDTVDAAEFIQQPAEAMAGEPLRKQPVVQFVDRFNNLVTSFEPTANVSIGKMQRWNGALNLGFGGWENLDGEDQPQLVGGLEAQAEGGIVQFVNVTVDRPVELLTLVIRACLVSPGRSERICRETESIAFEVVQAVQSLQLETGSLPTAVKAGRQLSPKLSLFNDDGPAPSTSIVHVSSAAAGIDAVKDGEVARGAVDGVAQFSGVVFNAVGVLNVTFSVERALLNGGSPVMLVTRIVVEAGDAMSLAVLNNSAALNGGMEFQNLTAGQPFLVEVEILDTFGNRVLSPDFTPVARAPPGTNYKLFEGSKIEADPVGLISNTTDSGVAIFSLRVDVAAQLPVHFAVALSPADECPMQSIWDDSPAESDCLPHPRGLQYCEQSGDYQVEAGACSSLPLCSYINASRSCKHSCECQPTGVRQSACAACVATTSLMVRLYASLGSGEVKLTVQQQPSEAIDGYSMGTQPQILVQICTNIANEYCNPIKGVQVSAYIQSASDECSDVGLSSCTGLFMGSLNQPCSERDNANCSAVSDENGVATFAGLGVNAPGNGAARDVIIGFTYLSTTSVPSAPFELIAQMNQSPQFEDPTPVRCDEDDTPLVYYAGVGSSLHVELAASDANTAPYDKLTIVVACGSLASPVPANCEDVLPPGAYLTENMYDASSMTVELYNPECDVDQTNPKARMIREKNRVSRHFVWSPVAWYPAFFLRYKSVEAARSFGVQAALSTCERAVQIVVCDRPRFVAPSPIGVEGHLLVLAHTDIVFTVAALDRNEDDVVEIIVTDTPDLSQVWVGPNVHDEELLVTGLEEAPRNRVSRNVRWAVPNDGLTHSVCFRARDNQFPCGDGSGLVSEDTLCVHCTLEPLGTFTTCSSSLKAQQLDVRTSPVVCGDGRMTDDSEECDDGNQQSGDGCSSLCTLEGGYDQLDDDPAPENICGDGLVVIGETCDDNNTDSDDGCSVTCTTEAGFTCLECGGYSQCNATCGDGIRLQGEECDDSNTFDDDGCSHRCQIEDGWEQVETVLRPICGDGKLKGNEQCDDGNTFPGDGCSATCTIEDNWDCGGGVCKSICGDGIRMGSEQCDDGNLDGNDGCDPSCAVEDFFSCVKSLGGEADICTEICGDGERVQSNSSRVRPGFNRVNECDDGNILDGDGCSAECEIEAHLGWECLDDMAADGDSQSPRSVCSAKCGDGMRTNEEECDDGNMLSRDGCSSTCTVETGYVCSLGSAGAEAQMLQQGANESCLAALHSNGTCCFADGNVSYAKSCSPITQAGDVGAYCLSSDALCASVECEPTAGKSEEICYLAFMGMSSLDVAMDRMHNVTYVERGAADTCTSSCGDGHRALQEECDDANLLDGDGCSASCKIEAGWYCLHQQGPAGDFCSTICGDAVLVPDQEECDDGAWTQAYGDGCTSACKLEPGFNCTYDAQHRLAGGRCKPICGDGWWVLGEACDDHNLDDDDGCSSECKVEDGWVCGADGLRPDMNTSVCIGLCGDGIKVSGEECDDNNIRDQDGCTSSCKIEPGFSCLSNGECFTVCGDGVVMGKESCDDGNSINGDGCTDDCLIEHGYQCISANCTASGCKMLEGGQGSFCQECPPVRQTAARCSHPPCPVIGLTADCEHWFMTGDGSWVREEDMPPSSVQLLCKSEWYGDGFCDALNNRDECTFDGGDCCERSCMCGGASSRTCYNGVMGGCGTFKGKKGDYRCIQSLHPETGVDLAAEPATIQLSGGQNIGADLSGPYLSWVQVDLAAQEGLDIYFSTDGRPPAEETPTELLVHGQQYTGPFNLTANTLLRVSTVGWGLGVGQRSMQLKIQVARPVITPSPAAGQVLPSPVLVSIMTATPGATIKYSIASALAASDEEFVYAGPFAIDSVGAVTAWAEKTDVETSETTSVAYTLQATTPVIVPSPGSYLGGVGVNVSTETVQADVYVTVCEADQYPGWVNKSVGQIYQTASDFYCFPDCQGLCIGGYNDQKPCGGATDLLTCGGGGVCSQTYRMVRLCFPHEWPPGRFIFDGTILINQTMFGSGAWVTSFATRQGMADSNFTTQQYFVTTQEPTLTLLPSLHPPLSWPDAKEPILAIPFTEHGQETGPYPSPLYFNFSTPTPADVYYTLDGSQPVRDAPGTTRVPYDLVTGMQMLNASANITWMAIAPNLAPSIVQQRSVAVQAVTPELLVDVRFLDKADGLEPVQEYDGSGGTVQSEFKGLVVQGFAYPGVNAVSRANFDGPGETVDFDYRTDDSELFSNRPSQIYGFKKHGYPMLEMRAFSQYAGIYYRLRNGTEDSFELPTWPSTSLTAGSDQPNTAKELHEMGWIEYDPAVEIMITRNVTVELMAAAPGTALINSNVVKYPLFIREKCEAGMGSLDGYGPCFVCPLDTYMACNDEYGEVVPPCICKRCEDLANRTGTFEVGMASSDKCQPFCLPGSFSIYEGIDANATNCTQCHLGTYSDSYRATACTACPVGTSTWRYGAHDISQCRGAGGIIAGGFHSCGVDTAGRALCWGYNGFGQTDVPQRMVSWEENGVTYEEMRDDTWLVVSAGSFFSCGINTAREAKCWGQDYKNKTSVPTMHLWESTQLPLQPIREWHDISTSPGYHHACGIADHRAVCWGDDEYGQIQVPRNRTWQSVSVGEFHTCGVDRGGTALCWGDDSYGQSEVPAVVDEGPWRNVSAGMYHTCGVTAVGKMHCWGSSLYAATAFPRDVAAWSGVAVGKHHSCGLTSDGDLRCWGSSQDGATTVPAHVKQWRAVTSGLYHSCGITEDGTGLCWGRTVYGITIVPDAIWASA